MFEDTLKTFNDGNDNENSTVLLYPYLPHPPSSEEWKKLSSARMCSILNTMIACYGIGNSGNRKSLGLDQAPPGWPEELKAWADYKGATHSHHKKEAVSSIIFHFNCYNQNLKNLHLL